MFRTWGRILLAISCLAIAASASAISAVGAITSGGGSGQTPSGIRALAAVGQPVQGVGTAPNGMRAAAGIVPLLVGVAPVILEIPDATITAGVPYTGPTPTFAAGSSPITWSLVAGPAGMTINSSTGVVSWPSPTTAGSPHTVTIRATNDGGFDDESWILTVVQPCTYAISPPNTSFAPVGGAGAVNVTAPGHCNWSASTTTPWITLNGTSGSGSAALGYTVAPNYSTTPRNGSITVAGQVHTVFQEGYVPAATRFAPQLKTLIRANGTGWQELVYNYDTGAQAVTPYQGTDGFVVYDAPLGQWVGIYHFDYGTGRFSEAVYVTKQPLW